MRTTCLFLALMVAASLSVADISSPPYSAQDCVRLALANSATARTARIDETIARALVRQAWASAYPDVRLSGSYTRLDELTELDLGEGAVEFGSLDNYSVGLRVDQLLFSGGRVGAGIRAASLARDMADAALGGTQARIARDVRLAFNGLLLAREHVSVQESSIKQLESLVTRARQLHEHGTGSEFDLLRAQVLLGNAKPDLLRARNALSLGFVDFRRLLGLMATAPLDIDGKIAFTPAPIDVEERIAAALANRPDISSLRTRILIHEQEVQAARSGLLPEVSAGFAYTGGNAYGGMSLDNDWTWHWNATATLGWGLWDGGRTAALKREKQLDLEKARIQLEDVERQVTVQIRSLVMQHEQAWETVEAARANMGIAERALDIARSRHESGLATHLDFTDAELEVRRAKLAVASGLRDCLDAIANLDFACGQSVEQLLEDMDHGQIR